jgi:hypothetical protein
MKSIGLLALLPALTCAFFLPIPPLFNNQLLNSSHVSHASHVSHDSNTSHTEVIDANITYADFKEICTIVEFTESELCGNATHASSVPPQLCSLLSLMNQTFCQDETREKGEKGEKHVNENENGNKEYIPMISEKNNNIYEKFYATLYIDEIKNNNSHSHSHSHSHSNTKLNPKDLCPVFDLVDKTFCTSSDNKLNPKDLCPLLEFVEKELCV